MQIQMTEYKIAVGLHEQFQIRYCMNTVGFYIAKLHPFGAKLKHLKYVNFSPRLQYFSIRDIANVL